MANGVHLKHVAAFANMHEISSPASHLTCHIFAIFIYLLGLFVFLDALIRIENKRTIEHIEIPNDYPVRSVELYCVWGRERNCLYIMCIEKSEMFDVTLAIM